MKKGLLTLVLMAWVLLLTVACKSGIPGPQSAFGVSARLISISPKMNAPIGTSDADLESNIPNSQLPLQSQLAQ